MESKHFSHEHVLSFQQVPPGSQIMCSGCKSTGSGNIYGCWQCSYFLHEQCLRAPRSFKHPSHPLHPLTLAPFPTYPSASFICNSCSIPGHGFSYTCSECEFDIHLHCAFTPHTPTISNDTHNYPPPPQPQPIATPPPPPPPPAPQVQTSKPQSKASTIKHFSHPHFLNPTEKESTKVCSACELELSGSAYTCTESTCSFSLHKTCFESPHEVHHKSHPEHPLTLQTAPPYSEGFACNACLKDGKAFAYTCATCSYDLHINCIQWPESETRSDHEHPLTLYYSSPLDQGVTFTCDACKDSVDETAWVYYCRECDFGTHLDCVHSEIKQESVADRLFKMQEQQAINAFQLQMARQNAQFMMSLANSWKNF